MEINLTKLLEIENRIIQKNNDIEDYPTSFTLHAIDSASTNNVYSFEIEDKGSDPDQSFV